MITDPRDLQWTAVDLVSLEAAHPRRAIGSASLSIFAARRRGGFFGSRTTAGATPDGTRSDEDVGAAKGLDGGGQHDRRCDRRVDHAVEGVAATRDGRALPDVRAWLGFVDSEHVEQRLRRS